MARRDNTFLVVAVGLAAVAWVLFRPKGTGAAPATHADGTTGGAVSGSPNQVLYTPQDFAAFDFNAPFRVAL